MRIAHLLATSLVAASSMAQQPRPPEIPGHYEAVSGTEFLSAKTFTVSVTSRSATNPDPPVDLDRIRHRATEALSRIHKTLNAYDVPASAKGLDQ